MLKSVVVGIDGSQGSRDALSWIGGVEGVGIHCVCAVSPALELLEASVQIDSLSLVAQARKKLDVELDAAGITSAQLGRHVIEDTPVRALIDTARRLHVDAIVIGASGHDHIAGLVGVNAGRIIHLSDVPVIIVPATSTSAGHADGRIVVGVTGTRELDTRLVEWARGVGLGCGLELLRAVRSASQPGDDRDVAANSAESSYLQELLQGGGSDDHATVTGDDPISAMVEASATAPLAVIGSHHSSRLGGFLTGAISQHLPAVSPCAVAVVPLTSTSTNRWALTP